MTNSLTSFLHEGEKVIQELLPVRVVIQLIQLSDTHTQINIFIHTQLKCIMPELNEQIKQVN